MSFLFQHLVASVMPGSTFVWTSLSVFPVIRSATLFWIARMVMMNSFAEWIIKLLQTSTRMLSDLMLKVTYGIDIQNNVVCTVPQQAVMIIYNST